MKSRRVSMRSRGRRPQVMWERFNGLLFTVAGSTNPSESLLASPALLEGPTALDDQWTLRGMRLEIVYNYAAAVRVADDMPFAMLMLYMKDVSNVVVDGPSAPVTSDVLDRWTVQFPPLPAGQLNVEPLGISQWASSRKVKVMRKLDQSQGIFMSMEVFHLGGAASAGFFCRAFHLVSNLWSRTLR